MTIPSFTGSEFDRVARHGTSGRGISPLWARWNDELGVRYTLGVEEEVMLLEPDRWSLAQASEHVIARLSDELSPHTSPETHAAVVELATGVQSDVDGVVAELAGLRNTFRRELEPMGLTAAAAGTHPMTVWGETRVSEGQR